MCGQRVRKIVLHPTLHGEQTLGTASRTDPRVQRSAVLHRDRATDGEPAEVGTSLFMMRKSRLQRKPSFCVRCNTPQGRCGWCAWEGGPAGTVRSLIGDAGGGIVPGAIKHG
ncbi:hypothetical protein RSPO_m01485 (plasmid) [Ralstonia solanacearum Po82]|uniref:Uncharacterized protein n=1 Tax=Ralstonia solanacearum (strain Po82) TaxID=1031711 RepID=F6GAY7_RALS8|nr:hypothetical protein RSPO_m01485 [Ralstonia solanacearum Po82]